MKFVVLHSSNIRDTGFFDADDESIFGADAARKAIKAYKADFPPAHKGLYRFSGIVDAKDLHDAFALTQNYSEFRGWGNGQQRSTMVGDVFLAVDDSYNYIENQTFVVERFGFCQIMGA